MIRRWAVLLLALSLLVWFSGRLADMFTPEQRVERPPRHVPASYMVGVETRVMDAGGTLSHLIEARRMVRFEDDRTTELEAPRITTLRGATPQWRVSGERGQLNEDASEVRFPDAVTLSRLGGEPARLDTRALLLRPAEDYAETEAPVRYTSAASIIDAIGMRAFFGAEGRIELLNQVRGKYEPQDR